MRAPLENNDAELARASQGGNRDAFGQVVARYQSLICSLAYSATGNISRSEDLAQETFITAWKQLHSLREPERLRSWLCGIARNLINNSFRREGQQPVQTAEPLENAGEAATPEPLPSEQAISREEETLVWHALEQVPELYREPLVLYYREEQSVAAVATQLELSQDAVRQRLARGRELLKAEVASLVEGALRRSRPGRAFTLAVLASLPGLVIGSAKAASLGATGKVVAAKVLLSSGSLGGLLGGLGGLAGGALGGWASWQTAQYQPIRDLIKRSLVFYGIVTLVFVLGIGAMSAFGRYLLPAHAVVYGVSLGIWIVGFVVITLVWSFWIARVQRRILAREIAAGTKPLPQTPVVRRVSQWTSKWEGRQWRSRWSLLGLPIIHINFTSPRVDALLAQATVSALPPTKRQTARGWIALGDRAQGILFACGGQALGGIAIGGVSIGLLSFGGLAIGGVCIGGGAVGVLALGGAAMGAAAWAGGPALGWVAFGSIALAWHAAQGCLACAHDFAVGLLPIAQHANDAVAKAIVSEHGFFKLSNWLTTQLANRPHVFLAWVLGFSLLVPALMFAVGYRRTNPSPSQSKR